MNEDIENWKYHRVQKYAGTLGLPRTGKKIELIQRIRDHFKEEEEEKSKISQVLATNTKTIVQSQELIEESKQIGEKKAEPIAAAKHAKSPNMNELSILTDDNSFNQVQSKLTCETIRINNDLKNNLSPMVGSTPISRKRSISATTVVSTKTTNKQDEQIGDAKKTETVRSSRGARITRPVVNGVEIRQRSAGPTIIKPDKIDEIKTKETVSMKITKKPDFKTIHEKLVNNMESIGDNVKRIQDRHEHALKEQQTPLKQTSGIPKLQHKLASLTINQKAIETTPKVSKSVAKTPTTKFKQQIKTVTPKPLANVQVETKSSKSKAEANVYDTNKHAVKKTPKTVKINTIVTKLPEVSNSTPKVANTPKTIRDKTPKSFNNFNIVNAGVTPQQKKQFKPSLLQPINFNFNTSSLNTTTTINKPESTFARRKSFNLNASLSRPLTYNPHIGRMKPIKFDSKSIFLQNKSEQTGTATKPSGPEILQESNKFHSDQHTGIMRKKEKTIRQTRKSQAQMENRNITMDLSD